MVKHCGLPGDPKSVGRAVYGAAGGHAGLTRMLLVELIGLEKTSDLAPAIEKVAAEKEEAFRRINDGLSSEAASIQDLLCSGSAVTGHQAETRLQACGLDRFTRPLCLRELRFSGVAVGDNAQIRPAGRMYWKFYAEFASQPTTINPQPTNGLNYVFRKDGTTWLLTFTGKQCHTEHSIGLSRIRQLIQSFGKWTSVVALAQEQEIECNQAKKNEQQAQDLAGEIKEQPSSPVKGPSAAKQLHVDDMIDPETEKQVRQEMQSLEREIEELENAPETEDSLLNEKKSSLKELKRYLANAARTRAQSPAGGTSRKFSTIDEKARKAVSKSIKEAIEQIRKDGLPELADHLKDFIRYERYEYAYLPGNASPPWHL